MGDSGQDLYRYAKTRIPGGTQLLSKRPERFLPDGWPSYYERALGAEIWDLDGKRYLDMSQSGVGACILGYADPEVDAAVKMAIDLGSMSTLNCREEVELADLLCELHPWAEMVRYARGGGEAMAVAVRIARASTGRDLVAFCGYHGWHDWYLAANLTAADALGTHLLPGLDPAGVPSGLRGSVLPFHYNETDDFGEVVRAAGDRLAAVVMEPVRSTEPHPEFLATIRKRCTERGAVLVFDEVTSAWRMNSGGAHLLLGVEPDVVVFAKAMSNGYPMAAIIGRREIMEAAQRTFISSTYWTERIGPSAGLATIRKHVREDVGTHLMAIGKQVQEGWNAAAEDAGVRIHVEGIPPLSHFHFEAPDSEARRTLFTQMLLDKGFLATNSFYASYAHRPEHVEQYLDAVRECFGVMAVELEEKGREATTLLRGPVAHVGFKRLT